MTVADDLATLHFLCDGVDEYEDALARVEAEIARLEAEVRDKHGMMRAAIEDAEAAETEALAQKQARAAMFQAWERERAAVRLLSAEVARLTEVEESFKHLSSEYHYDMDRGDHVVYAREWEAFNAWQRGDLSFEKRALAAEAEVARLRDGLREIATMPVAEGPGVRMRSIARALLSEDGAAHDPFKGSGIEPHHRKDFHKAEDGAPPIDGETWGLMQDGAA